jgi:hypothetical protein
LNGKYGTEKGFAGRITSSELKTKGTVSFKDGKAEVKGGKFTKIDAKEWHWADFSSLTMSNFKIGDLDFTVTIPKTDETDETNETSSCDHAKFYYDGKNSITTWKKDVFKGGKWTKKGMWFAKDNDWQGGFDADGIWHDKSPIHWGSKHRNRR